MCIITNPKHKCGHDAPEDQKTYEYYERYNRLYYITHHHAYLDHVPEKIAYDLAAQCLAIPGSAFYRPRGRLRKL